VHHRASDIVACRNGILERTNGETRLHPGVDRVPEDLVPEHVPDRAERELSLHRSVFGDVGEPGLARTVGGELVPDQTVLVDDSAELLMNRKARPLRAAAPYSSQTRTTNRCPM